MKKRIIALRRVTAGSGAQSITNDDLAKRDYVVMIDKSGSMGTKDCPGGKSRWDYGREQAEAIARECEAFDNDGIDVQVFGNTHKEYPNTTASKVAQIFKENSPSGGTDTASALKYYLDLYFERKKTGKAKPMTIVVITDGEPNDRKSVDDCIIEATKKMDADEELAITFVQIGGDEDARKFLKHLDDDLQGLGAKFDIVDTKNEKEWETISIRDLLAEAITD